MSKEDRNKHEVYVTSRHRSSPTVDWSKQRYRTETSQLRGLMTSLAPLDPPAPPPVHAHVSFKTGLGRYTTREENPDKDCRDYEPVMAVKSPTGCSVQMGKTSGRRPIKSTTLHSETFIDMNFSLHKPLGGCNFKKTSQRKGIFVGTVGGPGGGGDLPPLQAVSEFSAEKVVQAPPVNIRDYHRHIQSGLPMATAVGRKELSFEKPLTTKLSYEVKPVERHLRGVGMKHQVSRMQADKIRDREAVLTQHCNYSVRMDTTLRQSGTVRQGAVMARQRYRKDARAVLLSASADVSRSATSMSNYKESPSISRISALTPSPQRAAAGLYSVPDSVSPPQQKPPLGGAYTHEYT